MNTEFFQSASAAFQQSKDFVAFHSKLFLANFIISSFWSILTCSADRKSAGQGTTHKNEMDLVIHLILTLRLSPFLSCFPLHGSLHRHICNRYALGNKLSLFILITQTNRRLRHPPQTQVKHLDQDREAHCEVNVSLRDMLVQALDDQREADQQEKTQSKHLDGRMALDKISERSGSKHHYDGGDDHCRDHD